MSENPVEEFRGPGDSDVMQNDMRHLMDVLNISTHARPISPHEVFISEIIPEVVKLIQDQDRLRNQLGFRFDEIRKHAERAIDTLKEGENAFTG